MVEQVVRQLTYRGTHTIELNRQEIACESLVIVVEVLEANLPLYKNEDYSPDRTVYGRCTGAFFMRSGLFGQGGVFPPAPEFVEKDFLIQYPQQLIYKGYLTDSVAGKLTGTVVSAVEPSLREQINAAPIDWKTAIRYVASVWIQALAPEEDEPVLPRPWGHSPTVYRVTASPEVVMRWTISARCSDVELDDVQDVPPPGNENPGDGVPGNPPVDEPREPPFELDEPPGGSDPENFFQPTPPPVVELPNGEEGLTYTVDVAENWIAGGSLGSTGIVLEPGALSYTVFSRATGVPGPVESVEPQNLALGGGSVTALAVVRGLGGAGVQATLVSIDNNTGFTDGEVFGFTQREVSTVIIGVTEE